MSVKMEFAIFITDLVHISERLSKTARYLCPLCQQEVIARKGSIRRHHFAHKPDSECTANEESILHFNAKHYLSHCINHGYKRAETIFNIPSRLLDESLQEIMNIMGMEYYPISLQRLCEFYKLAKSETEQRFDNYIVDVLGECYENKVIRFGEDDDFYPRYGYGVEKVEYGKFIFEIQVTHEIGEHKEKHLLNSGIPYIEAKPVESDQGFNFMVTAMSELTLMTSIKEQLISFLGKHFEKELTEVGKSLYEEVKKNELKKQAVEQLYQVVDTLNLRTYIDKESFQKLNTFRFKAYNSTVKRIVPLTSIMYKRNREGKSYVSINDAFSWIYSESILFDIVKHLHLQGYGIEILLGGYPDKGMNKVVGFQFLLPDKFLYGEQLKRIIKAGVLDLLNEIDEE